ncbi:electron transport complex subunit RsxD [Marinomonas mediterranea]|jgi:electron transport complex, RnfABCDGE type, D subunit|uniref:Ion-translocating oxidoreductase complex subunit D n=1 Tax=Marinomonas mediterranea (strain ATCC 700492 / JCM 21426 / NBRC 103028 / MMB-1) TaxID=717774 RepID=F2K0P5_MARM1|nr:electron transport complex subunit RsxD [Marinomonas mediterranea]ADZ92137.1 Electron transport complex protein rnfD [Marinomonas mediterranea MMB-1]WCN10103.1 electron transport complex subunit RsxD [Marinomonas mediterranea]WCN14146.1 electron transport complex subunit RsxD [Marinomonas mediterranea]WCN18201.1 electron transport complex subunit RsxD [Marinomonas mediterranea MMB-1]
MALLRVTSPHTQRAGQRTAWVMQMVILATIPGLAVQTWLFGFGTLINLVIACATAIVFEAALLKVRQRSVAFFLKDYSALLTAVLLALALPPTAPWWLTVTGVGVAIVLAKQVYGGLGNNPFNPAMVGYAILLVSFPVPMTQWIGAQHLIEAGTTPSFSQSLQAIFSHLPTVDSYTMATPLDAFKHAEGADRADAFASVLGLQSASLTNWISVNLAYLLGGLFLLKLRIITWHTPVALLAALAVIASLFFLIDPSHAATPWFHLTSGAAMFGAFFIATDPVSSCTSNKGKLVYGAGIGILIYIIRTWGGYPDGVAFAVLLMNFAAPLIDYYTQPRAYGHKKAKKGLKYGDDN